MLLWLLRLGMKILSAASWVRRWGQWPLSSEWLRWVPSGLPPQAQRVSVLVQVPHVLGLSKKAQRLNNAPLLPSLARALVQLNSCQFPVS